MIDSRCGTYAGVAVHDRRDEKLCDPCRLARNAFRRQLRAQEKTAVHCPACTSEMTRLHLSDPQIGRMSILACMSCADVAPPAPAPAQPAIRRIAA